MFHVSMVLEYLLLVYITGTEGIQGILPLVNNTTHLDKEGKRKCFKDADTLEDF